ncbi:MAG TPA: hypothetical protein PL115_04385 [Bacteroidales bacterium]|jgi:hypothetical protein|nr:hypothetical protein [Bacteroidales bacterium]HPB89133.1 hypothetical protein [Bacteroidales bacterium]HPY22165.1 hypothetical protein [Bacteroidales bacterium]HQA93185.1 hypothetical protein [Bacteroidales bacterium]HQN24171.1 hypothetical protein [Bacteroidales bacterium]
MKKIVLMLLLTMLSFGAVGANEGKIDSTLVRLKSEYEIETMRMGGKLLRMMMPLMKMDRQTKKAFKAMNIEEIVIADYQDKSEQIASKVTDEITKALEAEGYVVLPPQEPAQEEVKEEIKWAAYTLIEEDMVYGYAILTYFPKASFLLIRCLMNVSELEKLAGMIKHE